ncbi:MAG TPA: ABC transporter ATP-binding protein [Pyrinomonadaceae bacterium]|jgi:ABC-type multidrug transport system ATPase subunit|nr:ABC transporter ATP-binding protein [Pyrinomonadaceae bacterium]
MLAIKELNKTYASGVHALKGITLDVPPGMFGLLGPNGAGKTTLMKILASLLEPDSGTARMRDTDLILEKHQARMMLGYLPQEFGFYPTLTAEQTLHYFARLKGVHDRKERESVVNALLERVNLERARRQKVGSFSGGMQQRLGIAQALIGKPALLIVDEPTSGLDPEERARFHNLLAETFAEESVVLLSTHIVSDVSNLCSNMAIIRQGEIIASCAPSQAIKELTGSIWEAMLTRDRVDAVKASCKLISSQMYNGMMRVRVVSPSERPGEEFSQATPTIEDYYFNLVSHS